MTAVDAIPSSSKKARRSPNALVDERDWPAWCASEAPVGLLWVEGERVLRVNRAAAELLNVEAVDLCGSCLRQWFDTQHLASLLQANGDGCAALIQVRDRGDAGSAPQSLRLRAASAPGGSSNAFVLTLDPVRDASPAFPSVAAQRHDEGRAAFLQRLDSLLVHAGRQDGIVGVLVLQVDQMQLVTETLGYAGGDALIDAVRARLAAIGGDRLMHLGNGEFAAEQVRLPSPPEAAAQKAAQSWVQALTEPFVIGGQEVHATCSIGAALFPNDGHDAAMLLDRAQAAMRQAHAWGRNHVFFHSPEASMLATSRLARESALRHAIERGEMHVNYQPQIDLYSGRIVGFEALARWRHDGKDISPAEFIPLAEQSGLIVQVGEWVLREACKQGLQWREAGLSAVRIGVNLSMKQLEMPDLVARVRAILDETGFPASHLGLEITESMLFDNIDVVAQTLTQLRADGIEIALDDFGTGYSNLGYLSKLPIDVLKIDRAFVPDVTAAPDDVSIARAMIKLAHSLHMTVLAEGVETAGQLAMLVASGCDQVQGYFFSRPVPPDAVVSMLRFGLPTLGSPFRRSSSVDRVVLVVDGDTARRDTVCRELECVSDEVLVAASGKEALHLLAGTSVGVLLAAHVLPDMDGMDLLGRAKSLYPSTMRLATVASEPPPSLDSTVNRAAVFRIIALPGDAGRLRSDVDDAFHHGGVMGQGHRPSTGSQTLWQSMSGELIELRRRFDGGLPG